MSKQSNTIYQHLQEALQHQGCPICRIGKRTVHGYLDSILYESTTDPRSREELLTSFGFCYHHSRELLDFSGERVAAAIIEQAVLKEALRRLHSAQTPPKRSVLRTIQSGLNRSGPPAEPDREPSPGYGCMACAQQRDAEARAIEELLKRLLDDLETPLRKAGGLCWPHLRQAQQRAFKPAVYAALASLHEQLWSDLNANLDEFIRKNDYRFRHEAMTDDESAAISRAISVLTGERPPDSFLL